jgi:putative phosphonoacetaldehyde dehydrogenase
LKDTAHEVFRAKNVCDAAAAACRYDEGRIYPCDVTMEGNNRRIFSSRVPLRGLIGAITPFNHPLNTVAHKVIPAVASNNRIVLKPSEKAPLSALLLRDLLREAGMPEQMFSVLTGDANDIGREFLRSSQIDLITFTGSVAVGKRIADQAGYKRVVLELGGNDPFIVMEDADVGEASRLIVAGALKNSGQRCTAIKRVIVVESIADRLVAAVLTEARRIRVGDPLSPETDLGTVIDVHAATQILEVVDAAIKDGAVLLHGGTRRGAMLDPILLDYVSPSCDLFQSETFGPVIPITRCPDDIEKVISMANSTRYGLSSGVATQNINYIRRFIDELEVGTVNIGEVPGFRVEETPFGGVKDSGLGQKEGVEETIRAYTTIKTYSLPL